MIVCIDIGTSRLKTALYDPASDTLESFQSLPWGMTVAGLSGQMEVRLNNVMTSIWAALSRLLDSESEVRAIALTGQMHSAMIDVDGVPCAVSWSDRYLGRYSSFQELEEVVLTSLGLPDDSRFGSEWRLGLPVLSLAARAHRADINFRPRYSSLLGEVARALTGAPEVPVHLSEAAASGFFDLESNDWDRSYGAVVGVEDSWFPQVLEEVRPIGVFREIPVFLPVGDHQAYLFGADLSAGDVILNVSTGGQASTLVSIPKGPKQLRPYFRGSWVSCLTHLPAGRSLNALCRLFEGKGSLHEVLQFFDRSSRSDSDYLQRMLETSSGLSVDPLFSPTCFGFGGSLTGLTEDSMSSDLIIFSGLKGVAGRWAEACDLVAEEPVRSLRCCGGLFQYETVRRLFGLQAGEFEVFALGEASLLGASRLVADSLH